ncbi:MAG: aminotransferase class I/II-fold pyridoxal phosphate-dependent enzyme [Bacteroidaceae bacterium]|nr:aminotransferase class I/II-fold pyridoxal phosphate-dependent enzyme [Bacteroidaceae bacterium]
MQAVILAAGMGKRLGEYTNDNTKCMLQVNGIRLIDRFLDALGEVGVSRIVIVVGYKGANVKEYVGTSYNGIPIVYVDNQVYATTNNIYSLFLAKDYLEEDDTVLLESDLIFDKGILHKLISSPEQNLALVDRYESWMDGTVVTLDEQYRITHFIDKSGFRYEDIKNYYKTVNIYKFSKEFSKNYYVPFLRAYCTALGNNEYYEQVLKVITLLRDSPLKALPLEGETWYEIDDVQDLDIAEGMFAKSDDERYQAISYRYGGYWRYPHLLDFCYLVNPYFPPQKMLDEIKASFEVLVREYPSGMRVNSLIASKNLKVRPEYIAVGNGAAELIKSYMEHSSGAVGVVLPTFEEYPNRLPQSEVITFTPSSESFRYTADDLMNFFGDKQIGTLLLINPDNPSGNYIPFNDVLRLINWAKECDIHVVIDESFVDFVDVDGQYSLFDNAILSANPHLTVIKSISKSYGVPGLRLGVIASGDKELIAFLRKDVSIWNINSFAEFYLQIYEKYQNDYLLACSLFREERAVFYDELASVGYIKVFPSQANYFLCEVTDRFTSHELAVRLLRHGVFIKDCSGKKGFEGGQYVRIAVRDRKDNSRLVTILRTI